MTLGIVRPAVVLPADWRAWDPAKLEAVLAHERSHIQRRDPAVQLVSAIHRAMLWISPLSWFLHSRIVRSAEEASDDAALAATRDRAGYAKVLLYFMQRGLLGGTGVGVPMARHGRPDRRIQRILEGTGMPRGVTRWSVAAIMTVASPLACLVATAQARPEFEAADVRVSQVLPAERQRALLGRLPPGVVLPDGRYEAQRATLVDMIATAYEVAPDTVVGGPAWIEWNYFDVTAQAPPNTRPGAIPLMLQSLLADRFGLVVHEDTRPVPVYVLSLGTGQHKLKAANGSEQPACRVAYDNDGLSCRNTTMDAFAARLASAQGTKLRVLNSTGIEGSWDFEISYPRTGARRGMFGIPHPDDPDRGIHDAIEKQLGLKLELRNVAEPVLVVDRANETPAVTPPDVAARLRRAPVEFEVATVKPCKGFDRFEETSSSGLLVKRQCMPLNMHILAAWDFMNGPGSPTAPMEAPNWTNSKFFEIAARAPIAIAGIRDPNYLAMLRNLLVERFQMKTHYEDRPRDMRVLIAEKPELKRADPSTRTRCYRSTVSTRGSGIPTILTCQNVTMAQFAGLIGSGNGRFYGTVDETGLGGGWDLTVSWMPSAARLAPSPAESVLGAGTGASRIGTHRRPLSTRLSGAGHRAAARAETGGAQASRADLDHRSHRGKSDGELRAGGNYASSDSPAKGLPWPD